MGWWFYLELVGTPDHYFAQLNLVCTFWTLWWWGAKILNSRFLSRSCLVCALAHTLARIERATKVILHFLFFYITGCNKFTTHQNSLTVEGEVFLKSGNGILPDQCKAACVATTDFYCTAAVMRSHGSCYLTGYKPKGHYMGTHFYRICKGSTFISFYFLLYSRNIFLHWLGFQ